ncbi:hypothetical protein CHLRE_10g460600v5 [Chlamydomonas reinhardtii]|uniref:PPIase cyclophilin-type domain-containing protein n=1 Tax=Chlamydomonas reinhardtii TaxID=3055 RepID=A0A2K3DBU7_CHLRE|nr:uncharacterized protein CHLRE_10g460600v5 [Chlamydomonas reinhardtii]PNW78007.1 hypothetical protein CHLRE_10g460600v5 [Chlamydomonas reinhardtii]
MRSGVRLRPRTPGAGGPRPSVHTLILVIGLGFAVAVMLYSLHYVHRSDATLQPRRLGEAGSAIVLGGGHVEDTTSTGSESGGSSSGTGTGSSSGGTAIAGEGSAGGSSAGGSGAGEDGSSSADVCHVDPNNEYHGDVVTWGDKNMQASPEECCQSCTSTPGCNIWVYCGAEGGCGFGSPRPKGECWLKKNSLSYVMENFGQGHSAIAWTAGAVYSQTEYRQYLVQREEEAKAEKERLMKLRENPELPLVWIDVALNGTKLGRVEYVLFVKEAPRAAENFRQLCSGEKGQDASGRRYHLKGAYYYRIIDRFIDQTGADADGIYNGEFHDDPGGLALKHTHKGLLSMANGGPNTNGGHFSTIMGPAHHLDGSYTIFGEVVSGLEHLELVNALSKGQRNNELLQSQMAQIVDAGQTRAGTYVSTPEYQAVISSEYARIEWRNNQSPVELARLRKLYLDQSLPLVYLDVAIKGTYIGRMEFVLFAKQSPRAAESFRLMCTGEAGVAPEGHEGAGKPYHFKGIYFYRIIEGFIDQAGQHTDSPLGGLFLDDPDGLKLNHTHMGLLSMANIGPNTNGAHFSVIMGAPHHLDGHYTIFGELVDGHHVALAINALAHGQPNNEHSGSKDAQVIDSGQVRRGTYWDDPTFQAVIQQERQRIKDSRNKPKQ